jgi:UDP-N-acetylglucosamine 2-epimerase
MHPRTRAALKGGNPFSPRVRILEPLGYLRMLHLVSRAGAVLTDSGGLQEEAAALGVPLLIVRTETEWRYLVAAGAAFLVGNTEDSIVSQATPLLKAGRAAFRPVDLSDQLGAAQRMADIILQHANRRKQESWVAPQAPSRRAGYP